MVGAAAPYLKKYGGAVFNKCGPPKSPCQNNISYVEMCIDSLRGFAHVSTAFHSFCCSCFQACPTMCLIIQIVSAMLRSFELFSQQFS